MPVKFRSALALGALPMLATALVLAFTPLAVRGQAPDRVATPGIHARAARRLLIRNGMVIYGSARPPAGPSDVIIEDGIITFIGTAGSHPDGADAEIDATGKYLMPGIINTHMHWHEERQPGQAQPIQYERNLYLAAGVTTAREVGGDFEKSKRWQAESNAHTIVAPRILVYPVVSKGRFGRADEIRAWIRDMKQRGADGLKIIAVDRDQLETILDEAHTLGLKTTTHIGVEETTAKDYIELGVSSIEHFYGIADAALEGVQSFPPDMNYNDEVHRFARAGELWEQADRGRLSQVVDMMVAKHVGWSPTLSIYEASRDVVRAQNLPWFKDYLHPSLEAFFRPSFDNHGSYFLGWTSTQEAHWKRQYRVWMDVLHEFGRKSGLITTGDDAGYIYSMYGFGIAPRARAPGGGRLLAARSDRARDLERGPDARPRRPARQGARRVRRRPAGRQRQPARKPQAAEPLWHRRDDGERTGGFQLHRGAGERSRAGRPRRRDRVDHQGRDSVSRANADARSPGHGHGRPHPRPRHDALTCDREFGHLVTWSSGH